MNALDLRFRVFCMCILNKFQTFIKKKVQIKILTMQKVEIFDM